MSDFALACRETIKAGVCSADCCGLVGFEKNLIEKHKVSDEIKREEIGGLIYFLTLPCPFLKNNGCGIYEDRPEVCRIYGLHPKLPCPHLKPNGKKRSEASKKQIERRQEKLLNKALEN